MSMLKDFFSLSLKFRACNRLARQRHGDGDGDRDVGGDGDGDRDVGRDGDRDWDGTDGD